MPKQKVRKDKTKIDKKKKYKINNWSEYNKRLKQRGSIEIWLDENILDDWYVDPDAPKKKGAQSVYTDQAIITTLQLGKVFSQKLRQTAGLVKSIFDIKDIDLKIPDFSTLSRRGGNVNVKINKSSKKDGEKITIVADSSGMKVYGEGEWKVRKHGYSKRRTWRKIHLMSTPDGEIRAAKITDNSVSDNHALSDLLDQEEAKIEIFAGDGGYDKRNVYDALRGRQIKKVLIPPQKNAKIWQHGNSKASPHTRDDNLRKIRKTSRKRWKEDSGYHIRSLSETAFFRYKTIFGNNLNARNFENQKTEFLISVNILNKMTRLGMPSSYIVED